MVKMNKHIELMVQRRHQPEMVSMSDYAYENQIDPRRMSEIRDARMIKEDPHAIANLPNEMIHKEFRADKYMPRYWMESEVEPSGPRYNVPEEL